MRILAASGSFFPATNFGGTTASTRGLYSALTALDCETRVLTTNTNGPEKLSRCYRGWVTDNGYHVFYGNRLFQPDGSLELARTFLRWLPWADVVHANGTYNWFLPLLARKCARLSTPLVVSPRGSLIAAARRNRAWKKRLFDLLAQQRALSLVTTFHATTEDEARDIRLLVPGVPVAVIPNGVDLPTDGCFQGARSATDAPYIAYVGRLDPYKRVDLILDTFARVSRMHPELTLQIAGDGDPKYAAELRRRAAQAGTAGRVRFLGYVGDADKSRLLAAAEGLILASRAENFGMAVAEALAHGTPCVVARTAPWAGLEQERCGFWVDDSAEALAAGISKLMMLSPEDRRAMGERGRNWMQRDYSWHSVARRMLELYQSLLVDRDQGKQKGFTHNDPPGF